MHSISMIKSIQSASFVIMIYMLFVFQSNFIVKYFIAFSEYQHLIINLFKVSSIGYSQCKQKYLIPSSGVFFGLLHVCSNSYYFSPSFRPFRSHPFLYLGALHSVPAVPNHSAGCWLVRFGNCKLHMTLSLSVVLLAWTDTISIATIANGRPDRLSLADVLFLSQQNGSSISASSFPAMMLILQLSSLR